MTYDEVIELGWKDRWPKRKGKSYTFVFESPGYDYHIMSVSFDMDGFEIVMINCVPEKTDHNEWENSECHFYGELKTKDELHLIMRLIGIIEY